MRLHSKCSGNGKSEPLKSMMMTLGTLQEITKDAPEKGNYIRG
jgi:hypothetical protein